MKRLPFIIFFITIMGCTHFTSTLRPYTLDIIDAPIDIVWENTLQILPSKTITLKEVKKLDYLIVAKKLISFKNLWGGEITIRLTAKGEEQTIMYFEAEGRIRLLDLGHEERMIKNVFDRIKRASESSISIEQK